MIDSMKANKVLMWVIVALLLAVDFLAFHDIFEAHTVRDWLTLLTSIVVFIYFAPELLKASKR